MIKLSSVNSGQKITHKKDAWDAITHSVNAILGVGCTTDEVKKKWFDLKHEPTKIQTRDAELGGWGGGWGLLLSV